MDPEWREPTAFEIVLDTFCDECEVEFVENNSLPVVIDPRNPFDFNITYRDKVWYCTAKFQCKEDPDQFVNIARAYTNETIFAMRDLMDLYEGLEEESDNISDVVYDG